MPDKKGNLFLFEAIELRNEYDSHIKLLQELMGESNTKVDRFFLKRDDDEQKEPTSDFKQKELEERLQKLQTKRVKLNQEIQIANFKTQIDFNGEKISVAESLELRKSLLADKEMASQRVSNSAYKRVIHKEERDIIHEPKHSFKKSYAEYQENLKKIRILVNQIHIVNYHTMVSFKDE